MSEATPRQRLLAWIVTEGLNDEKSLIHNLSLFISSIESHQLLHPANCPDVIWKKWNTKVIALIRHKNATVRWAALTLLALTVRVAPFERVSSHHSPWSAEVLDGLKRQDTTAVQEAIMFLATQIATQCVKYAEPRREFLSSVLPKVMNATWPLIDSQKELLVEVLRFLAVLLRVCGTSLKSFAPKIEALAWTSLASSNNTLREAALATLIHLPFALSADFWSTLTDRVAVSLLTLLELTFGKDEAYKRNKDFAATEAIFSWNEADPPSCAIIVLYFQTLTDLLFRLLSTPYPGCIGQFALAEYMKVIGRALSLEPALVRVHLADAAQEAQTVLAPAQRGALALLAEIVCRFGTGLSPFASAIARALLKILPSPAASSCKLSIEPATRLAAMRVLPPFLGTFGNALAITFSAPLVPSLLESLQVEADAGPQLQARGKKRKPDSAPVTAVLTAPNAVDFALQTASLCALSAVLTNGGSLLEPALRFQIDRVLLRLSLQVQLPPLPESRLALYTALQSSIASSFGCRSPLLPFALASFTSGSNDVDPGVSSFCRQALAVCESMQFAHGAVSVPLIGTSEAAAHEASPAQAQQTHDGPVAFPTFSSHPTSATTSSSSSSAASSSFGSSRAFGESGSLDLTALPPRNVKSRATASTSSSASTASSPLPPATSFDFSPAPTNTATPMDVTKDLENDEADEASGELVEIVGTGPDDVSDDSDE